MTSIGYQCYAKFIYERGEQLAGQKYQIKGAIIRKNKKIILFLTILLSIAGIAHAEQTKTIKYLANEPLTLLDLGI